MDNITKPVEVNDKIPMHFNRVKILLHVFLFT